MQADKFRSCNSSSIRLRSDVIPMNSFAHWFIATSVRYAREHPCRLRLRSSDNIGTYFDLYFAADRSVMSSSSLKSFIKISSA